MAEERGAWGEKEVCWCMELCVGGFSGFPVGTSSRQSLPFNSFEVPCNTLRYHSVLFKTTMPAL